jgi:hypothetical protein
MDIEEFNRPQQDYDGYIDKESDYDHVVTPKAVYPTEDDLEPDYYSDQIDKAEQAATRIWTANASREPYERPGKNIAETADALDWEAQMRKRAQKINKARSINDAAENLENPTGIEAGPTSINQKTGAFAVGDAEQDGRNEQSEKAKLEEKMAKLRRYIIEEQRFLERLLEEVDSETEPRQRESLSKEKDTPVQPDAREYVLDKEGLLVPKDIELKDRKGDSGTVPPEDQNPIPEAKDSTSRNNSRVQAIEDAFDQGVDDLIELEKEEQTLAKEAS